VLLCKTGSVNQLPTAAEMATRKLTFYPLIANKSGASCFAHRSSVGTKKRRPYEQSITYSQVYAHNIPLVTHIVDSYGNRRC
jgi:hypothetical protein